MKTIFLMIVALNWFLTPCNADIYKGGTTPSYCPYEVGIALFFLPYNPQVIFAGDKIALLAHSLAQQMDASKIFCFSSDFEDFERLTQSQKEQPNLDIAYGALTSQSEGMHPYYPALPHGEQDYLRYPGSLLLPNDKKMTFLFGEKQTLPAFSLNRICEEKNIQKVDLFYLNCGGNELQILQSNPDLVQNAIVVIVKTYHRRIRQNLSLFPELDRFMKACDYELMSHYVYDGVLGDAMYVKRKYFSAVFRCKEF